MSLCVGQVGSRVLSSRVAIAVRSDSGKNLRIQSSSRFKSFDEHVKFPRGGIAWGTIVFATKPEQLRVLVSCRNCLGFLSHHSLANSDMSFSRERTIRFAIVRRIRFSHRLRGNRSIAKLNESGTWDADDSAAVVATNESSLPCFGMYYYSSEKLASMITNFLAT